MSNTILVTQEGLLKLQEELEVELFYELLLHEIAKKIFMMML